MKSQPNNNMRSGAALLVVLLIVMVVCVVSMGFLSRSNIEMACGQNTITRMQMDYLAEAGLVHAKTLLLNPQEVSTSPDGYWQGGTGLQIEAGDDYYDITVSRVGVAATERCTYDIQSRAYREKDSEQLAESNLNARLRLDPCIAYWAGGGGGVGANMTVYGDVYCNGALNIAGTVDGDVFSDSVIGAKTGQSYSTASVSVSFPNIGVEYFTPAYDYGGAFYSPLGLASEDCNCPGPFSPEGSNPAGVVYRAGNLRLMGDVTIQGTLVVDGNLTIQGPGTVSITALKNYPAVVAAGAISVEGSAVVTISGLVQADSMSIAADAGNVNVLGAIFIRNASMSVAPLYSGDVNIVIAPMISAVKLLSQGGDSIKWSPAGGAFLKYISRN